MPSQLPTWLGRPGAKQWPPRRQSLQIDTYELNAYHEPAKAHLYWDDLYPFVAEAGNVQRYQQSGAANSHTATTSIAHRSTIKDELYPPEDMASALAGLLLLF